MTDTPTPDEFTDVNTAVGEDWEAETTPYERIREVIRHTYSPVSANAVAEDALTSAKTARKHLNSLVEEGYVTSESGEYGGTHFRRSAESLVVEQAADILDRVTVDALVDRVAEMRETLEDYRRTYGVESPEELTVERTNRTLSEMSSEEPEITTDELREWRTTRRNLAFANAALSIANAEQYVEDGATSTDGSVPAH